MKGHVVHHCVFAAFRRPADDFLLHKRMHFAKVCLPGEPTQIAYDILVIDRHILQNDTGFTLVQLVIMDMFPNRLLLVGDGLAPVERFYCFTQKLTTGLIQETIAFDMVPCNLH